MLPRDQNAVILDRAALEREVERVIATAEAAGATVRVLGSIGVAIHCPDAKALLPAFERTYADIDFAAYSRQARELTAAFTSLGYREDREVSITSEGRRAIFDHPTAPQVHLDVFFDELEFCHRIPLAGRLDADRPTIPLAELLLSKLQIVKLNEKDVIDTILLLLDHQLGTGDGDVIDVGRVARLCADEWGLWRTFTMNLEKVRSFAAGYPQLSEEQRSRVDAAAAELKRAIDTVPKPLAWRMRDRIGDRRQWWTDVDEVR
ncbi:MAG TPA: hypothetical protein VFM38_05250 [Candidatus Limnocylindrales bacterium]|nr:hypothetical protein [Candidatus Limnocylindrales bacterium]